MSEKRLEHVQARPTYDEDYMGRRVYGTEYVELWGVASWMKNADRIVARLTDAQALRLAEELIESVRISQANR